MSHTNINEIRIKNEKLRFPTNIHEHMINFASSGGTKYEMCDDEK